jgi:hypothetical protein
VDDQGSILGRGNDIFFRHRFQTGSGAHPGSYPVSAGGSSSGIKEARLHPAARFMSTWS